jgi:hypothetical protein
VPAGRRGGSRRAGAPVSFLASIVRMRSFDAPKLQELPTAAMASPQDRL